ncbi:MAG: 7TM-DISM domain-containing protein, partial [Steroidobacteraceae bacterium]
MIKFHHHFWRLLLLAAWIGLGCCAFAAPMPLAVDVATTPHRTNINESMLWCEANLDATPDQVLAGGCQWQPMSLQDALRGVERSAFWMRVVLLNSSSASVSRWLKIGHSRTR